MIAFESITDPTVQRQLLEHSLQLLQLSQESRVRILRHREQTAGQLMGLMRSHAPESLQDDHLLMLQGPFQDMVLPRCFPAPSPSCMLTSLRAEGMVLLCKSQDATKHLWQQ